MDVQRKDAQFATGKSLRGGIPVCWPWFGPHARDCTLPSHGPARTAAWQPVAAAALDDGSTRISFELIMNDTLAGLCGHALRVQLHVSIGESLSLMLETTNLGDSPFTLTQALHSYFNVGDVRQTTLTGLDGCAYIDKAGGANADKVQHGDVHISDETDRIYLATGERDCSIIDPLLKRKIIIRSSGSDSMVVWNPWTDVAARMGDLGSDGYLHMLCVETTNAASDARQLAAGATHRLGTEYMTQALAG